MFEDGKLEFITYIEKDSAWPAGKWLEANQIEYMSFSVSWHDFHRPYDKVGFCFLNKDDSLMFALRWA